MKKIILSCLTILLLVGCSNQDKIDADALLQYELYWNSIINETTYLSSSRNFSIEAEIDKTSEGYEYYVVVDEPKIAMYDVKIMVIENRERFDEFDRMLPSVGIFDARFNMIPNQVRTDKNYREGAVLVRQKLTEPALSIQVMVTWQNYTKLDTFKEFFEFELDYNAQEAVEPDETDEIEETETETDA